jgi:hypothetical protein
MRIMTKQTVPTRVIANVLRYFGLAQGPGKDFQVRGHYSKGERTHTYVILHGDAEEAIFDNADAIERQCAAYGCPFYVSIKYFTSGKRWVTIDNHSSGRVREEPPAPVESSPLIGRKFVAGDGMEYTLTAVVALPGCPVRWKDENGMEWLESNAELLPEIPAAPESQEIATDDMLTVCPDGRAREIATTVYRNGEPERVRCTDGSEWLTSTCRKPTVQPVPDTPVQRVPLEEAAHVAQTLIHEAYAGGSMPSLEYIRMALEPYFQQARRDALNEAHKAVSNDAGRRERMGFGESSATAMQAIRRVRDYG